MWVYELSLRKALGSKLSNRLPIHVKQLNPVIVLLRNYHQFSDAFHTARMIHEAWSFNSEATKLPDKATVLVEYLYSVIVEVSNHYVPIRGFSYSFGVSKLAFFRPLCTKLEHKCSFEVKNLYSMVVAVCYNKMMIFFVNSYVPRHVKFT